MSTNLSINKFIDFLLNKDIVIVSLYKSDEILIFVEAKTPKLQKSFIIHVPSKYVIKCKDCINYKTFEITPISKDKAQKNIEYLSEIRGTLLVCDLISISSEIISLQKNNGKILVYQFGKIKKSKEFKDISPIDKLIDENNALTKLLDDEDIDYDENFIDSDESISHDNVDDIENESENAESDENIDIDDKEINDIDDKEVVEKKEKSIKSVKKIDLVFLDKPKKKKEKE